MIRPDVAVESGLGGAVLSCWLPEQDYRILVREHSRRRSPEDYPREPDDAWIWNENEAESQKGWVGLRSLADVQVAYGADGDLLILWPRLDQREAGWVGARLAIPEEIPLRPARRSRKTIRRRPVT